MERSLSDKRRRKKPGSTKTEAQEIHDRALLAEMYRQGHSHAAMAAHFGTSEDNVKQHIQGLRKEWLERQARAINEVKQEELDKLDDIEREAWAGWRRSQEDAERTVEETESGAIVADAAEGDDDSGEVAVPIREGKVVKRVERKGQVGDAKFLEILLKVRERKAKFYALDSPKRIDVRKESVTVKAYEVALSDASEEELRVLMKLRRKMTLHNSAAARIEGPVEQPSESVEHDGESD